MNASGMILIAGPTASGKSAAALVLAEKFGGEIVNADAMQVYRDLRIVTARPTEEDEARIPHHLYGVADGAETWSAGRWGRNAANVIADIKERGKIAIVTGGTGLYFRALEEGLSPIPETPPEIREAAKQRREELGAAAFREEVIERDPAMAHLPEGDAQRLLRAWEVYETTGTPLSEFQDLPREPLVTGDMEKAIVMPERQTLYGRCDVRAEEMLSAGAIEEVRALIARNLDPELPVMKALGVPEIAQFLAGNISREEALSLLQQNTRRFSKRQMTWFRHQTPFWPVFASAEDLIASFMEK